ncbi:transcriptional regulator, DeoR family [Pustulibacterium marinum]|uniref:Transcriptional regulator, DeoR family n=1 Tax=Pustulibacterium marinum TaxID=1224947 RepID=A0A1I7IQ60_9FLAO|nr:DeoR/GlpR family DNA-binding transcription regulator [Pustulibacterium marinum]SFU75085.1 transcriptional regulator, DeoR family [Pustulibacterium marinum]
MNSDTMKRHQTILRKIEEHKYVEVADLCKELNVSAVTIRKDLKFLEEKGLLHRTHGGASLDDPYISDRSVNEKEKIKVEEKSTIAKEAAKRVKEHDSILIASGTTVQALAKAIEVKEKLTVITASLNVAQELIRYKHIDVLQLGGYVRHSSSSVVGVQAAFILENISCSKLFLGVDGIDLEYGLSTTHLEEAQLNQKMIKAAERTIVLADSSKFGKKSFGRICSLDDIDEIITDSGISKSILPMLEEKGIVVTIVD